MNLSGKLVFLSGASRGFGRAIFDELIAVGANVVGSGTGMIGPEGVNR